MLPYTQRAQTAPGSIVFHSRADPGDEHVSDQGVGTSAGLKFQERLAKAVKIFEAYKDGHGFIHRVNLDILRQMCKDRGLPVMGQKSNLLMELKKWVRNIPYHGCISLTRELSAREYYSPT